MHVRHAIEEYMVGLINGTPSKATIQIAFYRFDSRLLLTALKAAHKRHVKVQVVADSMAHGKKFDALVKALGRDNGKHDRASFVQQCPKKSSCAGRKGAIMHDKFALFSSTDGKQDVVVDGSENAYELGTGPDAYNNALTLVNHRTIYHAYAARFSAMREEKLLTTYSSVTAGSTKVYLLPRTPAVGPTKESAANDPILGILHNVNCRSANTVRGYGPQHRTSIHIAMAQIKDPAIVDELYAMAAAGCVVHIVLGVNPANGDPSKSVQAPLDRCAATKNYIATDEIPYNKGAVGNVHSKYLLIDGNYAGSKNSHALWTGSVNYTHGAVYSNDESMLKIETFGIWEAYQGNFTHLTQSKRVTTRLRPCS